MKIDVYRFFGLIFLTILAIIGIGAALHIWVTLPLGAKGPEWVGAIGTWAGAFGTVSALFWTIKLAGLESMRRKQQERDAAIVAASFMDLRFLDFKVCLTSVIQELKKPVEDGRPVQYHWCAVQLGNCPKWTREELQPLLYLGNYVAANVGIAQEVVRDIASRLEDAWFDQRSGVRDFELWEKSDLNHEIVDTLMNVLERVNSAWVCCSDLLGEARLV